MNAFKSPSASVIYLTISEQEQIRILCEIARTNLRTFHSDKEYHNYNHTISVVDKVRNHGNDFLLAGWFHDVIYDEKPGKEVRSAEYFRDVSDTVGIDYSLQRKVIELILYTENHKVKIDDLRRSSIIIRADLAGFTDIQTAECNSHKLKKELTRLYRISGDEWARNTKKFLSALSNTIRYNKEQDETNLREWVEIENGIKHTISIL